MGWDRPLQGFFMVIEKESKDEPLWSNLDQDESHPKTLEPFMQVLNQYGISLPEEMLNSVKQDGEDNIGNKSVIHCLNSLGYSYIETFD